MISSSIEPFLSVIFEFFGEISKNSNQFLENTPFLRFLHVMKLIFGRRQRSKPKDFFSPSTSPSTLFYLALIFYSLVAFFDQIYGY